MSKKNSIRKIIRSSFNRNEKFTASNVPKHFESVTDESIRELKARIMSRVEQEMSFDPAALEMALKSADGRFEEAYSVLEGDYGTRFSNLSSAYTDGVTTLRESIKNFQLQAAMHNTAYDKYSAANEKTNNKKLPEYLRYSEEEMSKLKQVLKELEKE
jgi:hypothetical protein